LVENVGGLGFLLEFRRHEYLDHIEEEHAVVGDEENEIGS
jgi:hypothetical protein